MPSAFSFISFLDRRLGGSGVDRHHRRSRSPPRPSLYRRRSPPRSSGYADRWGSTVRGPGGIRLPSPIDYYHPPRESEGGRIPREWSRSPVFREDIFTNDTRRPVNRYDASRFPRDPRVTRSPRDSRGSVMKFYDDDGAFIHRPSSYSRYVSDGEYRSSGPTPRSPSREGRLSPLPGRERSSGSTRLESMREELRRMEDESYMESRRGRKGRRRESRRDESPESRRWSRSGFGGFGH